MKDKSVVAGQVSTHSRPRAAGITRFLPLRFDRSFNTQPPEGGWYPVDPPRIALMCFNTQPPEGGWKNLSD